MKIHVALKFIKKVLHSFFECAIILVLFRLRHPGELAQLARAPALHAGGQGFESLILHHNVILSELLVVRISFAIIYFLVYT